MAVYNNPHKALYSVASCTERCEYRYMRYGLIIAGGGKIFRPRLGCQCKKTTASGGFLGLRRRYSSSLICTEE